MIKLHSNKNINNPQLQLKDFVNIQIAPTYNSFNQNDFNDSNPFPRAEAINIRRNSDTLSDYI